MRNAIVFAIPVFLVLIGLEWALMRRKGLQLYRFSDTINDLSCGMAQTILRALAKTLVVGGYVLLYENARWLTVEKSSVTAWIALFFLVDFCYYWFHRWSHRVNAPWGAHIVHHQSEEFNFAVALRQGAFQPFFSSFFYLPLALIGFPPLMFLGMLSLNTVYQFWIHTRLIDRLGWLEWILNTPSHHRVHHGKNPAYLDKNYAGVLIIWDRMFGTFEAEAEAPVYGVTEPLRSWNPIWANFHTWSLIRDKARGARWQDKIAIWWKAPEWVPPGQPAPGPHPDVSPETYVKYDPPLPRATKWYLGLQFAPVFAATLTLLHYQRQLPTWGLVGLASFVFGSLLVLGGMFDGKAWARRTEWGRLLVIGASGPLWWVVHAMGTPTIAPAKLFTQPMLATLCSMTFMLFMARWLWQLRATPSAGETP